MSDAPKPSKTEQILILEPKHDLHFKGPYTEVVTSYLKLTNPSDKRVCFKVKTTAPKRYCVRPNNGIVEPRTTTTIAVMLQPFDIESQSDKNKHKFMVQTMYAPEGEVNQETLWKEALPEMIMDSKLKCVFDPPSGQSLSEPGSAANTVSPVLGAVQVAGDTSAASTGFSSAFDDAKRSSDEQTTSRIPFSEDKKYQDEIKKLKDELTHVREENMLLKEEGLKQRLKSSAGAGATPADLLAQQSLSGKGFEQQGGDLTQILLNPSVLALTVVLFALGVIIGKIVF